MNPIKVKIVACHSRFHRSFGYLISFVTSHGRASCVVQIEDTFHEFDLEYIVAVDEI